uniref:Uncharacterized protein n=1 Tax=Anguilla anguilla TaxID=7936 RepID=A0A0E9S0U7_ANGAN
MDFCLSYLSFCSKCPILIACISEILAQSVISYIHITDFCAECSSLSQLSLVDQKMRTIVKSKFICIAHLQQPQLTKVLNRLKIPRNK